VLGHHLPIDNCLLVLSWIARFRTRVSHKYIPCPLSAARGSTIRHCPARPKGPPVKRRRYASLISERVGLPTLHMRSPIIHCPLWQLRWRNSPTPGPGWPPSKSFVLKLVGPRNGPQSALLPGLLVLTRAHDAIMQPFFRLAREHADAEPSTSDDGIVLQTPPP
jgi:hypothetical protein